MIALTIAIEEDGWIIFRIMTMNKLVKPLKVKIGTLQNSLRGPKKTKPKRTGVKILLMPLLKKISQEESNRRTTLRKGLPVETQSHLS